MELGDGSPEERGGAAPALNPIQTKSVPLRAGSFTVLSLSPELISVSLTYIQSLQQSFEKVNGQCCPLTFAKKCGRDIEHIRNGDGSPEASAEGNCPPATQGRALIRRK